jgi:hypothetical protein
VFSDDILDRSTSEKKGAVYGFFTPGFERVRMNGLLSLYTTCPKASIIRKTISTLNFRRRGRGRFEVPWKPRESFNRDTDRRVSHTACNVAQLRQSHTGKAQLTSLRAIYIPITSLRNDKRLSACISRPDLTGLRETLGG